MRASLRKVLETGTTEPSASTLKPLVARGLCSPDGTLTAVGHVLAISQVPLAQQCHILGLPLSEVPADLSQPSPERTLMDAYIRAGTPCCFTEGGIVFVALYSLCFERLLRLGTAKWGDADYTATMMGKTRTPVQSMMYSSVIVYQEFLPWIGLEDELLGDIEGVSVGQAMNNFEVLQSWQSGNDWFPHGYVGLTPELVRLVLETLPRSSLVEIARLFFTDPHAYVKGWPDLTVVESGQVRFIEVKTSDRLHVSQIITIGEMKNAAGLNMAVTRLAA